MALTKNEFKKADNPEDYYPCATPDCPNKVRFTKEDEEKYKRLNFVDPKTGQVTKPRYCRDCREKRKAERGQR